MLTCSFPDENISIKMEDSVDPDLMASPVDLDLRCFQKVQQGKG